MKYAICSNMDRHRDHQTKSDVRQRKTNIICCHSHVESNFFFKENDIHKLVYKTETDSQILKTNVWLPKETYGVGDELRVHN